MRAAETSLARSKTLKTEFEMLSIASSPPYLPISFHETADSVRGPILGAIRFRPAFSTLYAFTCAAPD
jgi:hypothetical protein